MPTQVTLTRALLAQLYDQLFGETLPEKFLFGVRGAVPVSAGSLTLTQQAQSADAYDDAIGFMAGQNGHAYLGSVDPGKYYTTHPMDASLGCAHVMEGHYTFVKGPHKHEAHAWKGQNVKCWRDKNRNGTQDPAEKTIFVVTTSIDLHYGGNSNVVGEYSAGCQVVKQPNWPAYRDNTYSLFGNQATYWLLHINSLLQLQQKKPLPTVFINGVALPKDTPMWFSEEGRIVSPARSFLSQLQLDHAPIKFTYKATPTPAITFANGRSAGGKLVSGQLVCAVGDMLRALDAGATVGGSIEKAVVTATSSHFEAISPITQQIATLPEAADETPIPNP